MKSTSYLLLFLLLFTLPTSAKVNELKIAAFLEPPLVDYINNQWVGENIDMATMLAKNIGLVPVFIRCPFARCLNMVKNGQADMMMGLIKSAERSQYLTFIEPPYRLQDKPLRFFTLATKKITINQHTDLNKLLVGTLRGGAYYTEFDKNKTIKKVEVTSREQLVKMLLKGHIDTFLEREETIYPLLSQQDYQQKIALANYQFSDVVASYIAVSKKTTIAQLPKLLSKQLSLAIKSGEIIQVSQK